MAFTNFNTSDGLPDRHVNDFLETSNGTIYIATDGGLARLNPKGLASSKENPLFSVILPNNPKAKSIQVLFADETDTIWAGTSDGLYILNNNSEFKAVNFAKALAGIEEVYIHTIIKDRSGAMWIGTESGLFRILPNGEVEEFNAADGLPDVNISILREDKNGRIWVGLRPRIHSGLVLLVAKPKKNENVVDRYYTTKDGLPADWILELFESGDGKLWVGTTRGLCEWQGENKNSVCKNYTKANNLCGEEFWSIIEDKDNNLWAGTRCGVEEWTRYGFTSFTEGYSFVNSVFENSAGELFASFNNGAIRTVGRFDGEEFEIKRPSFPSGFGFGWGWKQTVWQDSMGDWWFPMSAGIYRFSHSVGFVDLSKFTPQRIRIGTQLTEVFRIFEDSRGNIWIATIGGVYELWRWERARNTWQNLTAEVNFSKYRIGSAFVEDKAGNLWIATGSDTEDAALIRYRNGQFKVFTQAENPLLAGWMRDLFVDDAGRLWIADTTYGVLRLDDVNADELSFTRYTPAEGLSSIGVSCITEDQFGRIYVGTGRGLDRLSPDTGQIENFTTADGLPNSYVEIAYRDKNNNLWFGTGNGLARFIPERARLRKAPNTLITGLRINGESQSVSVLGESTISSLKLNSDQRQVSVDFLALGASLGEKLKYEYRLGASEWSPSAERTINFASFASGDSQIEIRAVTADRLYSQPALISLHIDAPVWQRSWFIAIVLVIAGFMIYGFYRYRLLRLLEVANIRMGIATDLHDDIGANLTKIAILSEVAQQRLEHNLGANENGKDNLLRSVAEISRESVSSMGDIVWAINPKKDSLIGLTRRMRQYAEEILERRDIRLEFDAPVVEPDLKLGASVRRDLYLIFKECVNNIVRHSNAGTVKIDFNLVDKELILQISDDGIGFDATQEYDGNGLLSIKKRAEDCGGHLEIDSMKGSGTRIILRVKLRSAAWSWS